MFIPPQTLFAVGYTVCTRACVRACVRPSVTFCFFNLTVQGFSLNLTVRGGGGGGGGGGRGDLISIAY